MSSNDLVLKKDFLHFRNNAFNISSHSISRNRNRNSPRNSPRCLHCLDNVDVTHDSSAGRNCCDFADILNLCDIAHTQLHHAAC